MVWMVSFFITLSYLFIYFLLHDVFVNENAYGRWPKINAMMMTDLINVKFAIIIVVLSRLTQWVAYPYPAFKVIIMKYQDLDLGQFQQLQLWQKIIENKKWFQISDNHFYKGQIVYVYCV